MEFYVTVSANRARSIAAKSTVVSAPRVRQYTVGFRVQAEGWEDAARQGVLAANGAGYSDVFVESIKRKH